MKHIEFSGTLSEINRRLRKTELIRLSDFEEQAHLSLDIHTDEWHNGSELPRKDTEVLAKVKGFKFTSFKVLKHDGEFWWQHVPKLNDYMDADGWVGIKNEILKWKYIDDNSK